MGAKKTPTSPTGTNDDDMDMNLKQQKEAAQQAAAQPKDVKGKGKKTSGSRYMAEPRNGGSNSGNSSTNAMNAAPSSMDRNSTSSSSGGGGGSSGGMGLGGGLSMDIKKTNQPRPKPATERFKNNKGISSDMYFDLNKDEEVNSFDRKQNLQKFSGSTAIGSDAYFNRDDGAGARGRTDSSGDMAREMVAKAADDLRNLKDKASDWFASYRT